MGRIILNGKKYGGGGGGSADIVEVTLAEYIALGDVVNTDGKLYCITDLNNSDVQGYPPLIYSTDEREVGVWTDGKPLYQKVVKSTTTPTANAWNIVTLPADISVKIFDAYYVRTTGAIDKFSLYRSDTNPVEMLVCSISNSTVYYRISSPFVADFSEFVIIIQYTKTTDVAGSGIWNGQGGYAHHYSTSEKVIGTWIDGKPLYEKTWDFGSNLIVSYNSWTNTTIKLSDYAIKSVIKAVGYNNSMGACWNSVDVSVEVSSYVALLCNRNGNATIGIQYLTLQYTKTTD